MTRSPPQQRPHHVLALTEVPCSDPFIDAWWHTLRHARLFLHPLDSVAAVRRRARTGRS